MDLPIPYLVGFGTALIVVVVGLVMVYRSSRSIDGLPKQRIPKVSSEEQNWASPETSFSDRRGAVRREGQPVPILLVSNALRHGKDNAYVVDRSTGGLRIVTGVPLAPGSVLQVRAQNAPDNIPWVTVTVRNCVQTGKNYEMGCEFDRTPPWNILLFFG